MVDDSRTDFEMLLMSNDEFRKNFGLSHIIFIGIVSVKPLDEYEIEMKSQ